MTHEEILRELASLPPEGQRQVLEFITFLRQLYDRAGGAEGESSDLAADGFIGMWRGREDMSDSSAWVRAGREREWWAGLANFSVVDTDVLIDAARGMGEAVARLKDIESTSTLAVSAVTQMELFVGCRDKGELRRVEGFLRRFLLLKLTEPISDAAVDPLRQYRLSHGLLIADSLIAATALVHGAPLVSKNQRDYQFIAGLNLQAYP
jgi:predicted nucleic acid-binding protein